MASVLLSPVGNGQQFFDNNGVPLAGGLVYTYQAGSSTPFTTYTTYNGTIPNSNPIILDSAGRLPAELWFQTGYTYKLVIQTSAGVTLQTLDNLYPILQTASGSAATVPSGLISMWSGSIGSIPSGWVICDGTNATPDLRDRFIVGAGSTYSVAATGGSTDAIVVSHTHNGNTGGQNTQHYHGAGAGGAFIVANGGSGSFGGGGSAQNQTNTDVNNTDHYHPFTTNSTGTSGTNANLPPYYALAYIMKT